MTRALALAALVGAATAAAAAPLPPPAAVHGTFVQTKRVQGLERPLVSRGTFALLPGRGLVWRVAAPVAERLVLNGQGVFALEDGAVRQVAAGAEPLRLMAEVLAGDAQALARDCTVERTGTPARWSLRLAPRSGPLAALFTSLDARGGAFASEAGWVEASGDATRVRFEAVRAGAGDLSADEEARLGP